MSTQLKIGISAKFHSKAPVFYGESNRHIQYLETSIAKWVANNGALPLMIPSEGTDSEIRECSLNPAGFAQELDALILQGGVDVHPEIYGRTLTGNYPTDIVRDRYELALIDAFIEAKKPILGICRGLQLLNIYFGGTLHTDLETSGFGQHLDRQTESKHSHPVNIVPGSALSRIYTGTSRVISVHHQGIEKLGEGLSVEGVSLDDDLIEAISLINDDKFVLAVQWHPELHVHGQKDYFDANELLKLFVRVAKNRKFYGTFSLERKRPLGFNKSHSLTLGAELEVQVIDNKTLDLTPKSKLILDKIPQGYSKIKSEIFQSMLELETDVCIDALEIEKDLMQSHALLNEAAKSSDLLIGSIGIHPFAKTNDRILTPGNTRYQELIENKQWIARRIAIFGLHCHVGAHSPEEGIELYRFYLSICPLLLGLSSSSPFFEGESTGLHSVRSTFFESTPAGGHPPILTSWMEFEGMMTKLMKCGAIESHKDLWWDVRPSLGYGTIEVRICDSMPTIRENVALVALIHLLGHAYLNFRDYKKWPSLAEWSYRDNKWRALRFGTNFDFILNDEGSTIPAREYLTSLLDDFSGLAKDFGYEEYFNLLRDRMLLQTPSDRLMKIFVETGSLSKVVETYCAEFAGSRS